MWRSLTRLEIFGVVTEKKATLNVYQNYRNFDVVQVQFKCIYSLKSLI